MDLATHIPIVNFGFQFFAELPKKLYVRICKQSLHLCAAEEVSWEPEHLVEDEPSVRQGALASFYVELLVADNRFVNRKI